MRRGDNWLTIGGWSFFALNVAAAVWNLSTAIQTGNPVFAVLLMFNGFVAAGLLSALLGAR